MSRATIEQEIEANQFAMALLMPADWVRSRASDHIGAKTREEFHRGNGDGI